jgi:hypothetical protein
MPTYKNNTRKKIYLSSGVGYVNAGDTIKTNVYETNPGLDLESYEPYTKKVVLYCEDITIDALDEIIISIPHPENNKDTFFLTINMISNPVTLFLDLSEGAVGLFIDDKTYFHEPLNWRERACFKLKNLSDTLTSTIRICATSY